MPGVPLHATASSPCAVQPTETHPAALDALESAAAMLVEGSRGCGSYLNAAPSRLTRDSSLQSGYVPFEDAPQAEAISKHSRVHLPRAMEARMEVLGTVRPTCMTLHSAISSPVLPYKGSSTSLPGSRCKP